MVTGRVTRGKLKVGIDVDILGYDKQFKAKVNGKLDRFYFFYFLRFKPFKVKVTGKLDRFYYFNFEHDSFSFKL